MGIPLAGPAGARRAVQFAGYQAQPAAGEPEAAVEAAAAEPVVASQAEEPMPPPLPDRCAHALTSVADSGLRLPPGVDYRCPSNQFAHQGAACWEWSPCPASAFIAINLDRMAGSSPAYVRHVVAHEICHILDFQATGRTTEAGADACAAAYGFPA